MQEHNLGLLDLFAHPLNVRVIPPEPLELPQPDGSVKTQAVWSDWIHDRSNLIEIAMAWDGEADVYFCPQTVENGRSASKTTVTHINALTLDLDFDIAGRAFGHGEVLERCRQLRLDAPAAIVATGGGYHVYWVYGRPLYAGPRKGEPLHDRLARLADRAEWHAGVAGRMVRLFADLGADPKATDLPHVYRVPGFQSVKRGERVEVVHLDAEATTSLKALSYQSRATRPTERHTSASETSEPTNTPTTERTSKREATQSTPGMTATAGYQWLRHSHFVQGNRHDAHFALAATLKMAGWSYADAWKELADWRRECTTPTWSKWEAQRSLKAIWQHGYGLDKDRLLEIHDSSGRSMPEPAADDLVLSMPRTGRPRTRRQKLPIVHAAGRIMSYLVRHQVTADTPLSAQDLAAGTGLSRGQVERIQGAFDAIGVRKVKRRGRSWVSVYNLKRLSVPSNDVINKIVEWISYAEDVPLTLWKWWRRIRSLMVQVMAALRSVLKLIPGGSEGGSPDEEAGDGRGERLVLGDRAPPVNS